MCCENTLINANATTDKTTAIEIAKITVLIIKLIDMKNILYP